MTSATHAATQHTLATLTAAMEADALGDYFRATRDWRTKRHLEELEHKGSLPWAPEQEQVDYRAIPGSPHLGLSHVVRVSLWCLGTAWAVNHYDSLSGEFDTLVYRGRQDAARAYNHLCLRSLEV